MLQAEGVWFRYENEGPWVLSDVSLSVEPGEVVGLCGPSGGGKSTLGRVLGGFRRPDRGSVVVDGARKPKRGAANPVQIVLQHPELAMDPRWTVREVLLSTGVDESEIDALDARFVAPLWMDRYPHEISGGELQRVNLARALLSKPRYVIADEITASLDTVTQARIWTLLLEHCRENEIGLIAISHDRTLLDHVADRVITWDVEEPADA